MSQLVIRGHATRGKEVIEILKMLGGNNPYEYAADNDWFCFYIGYETRNICCAFIKNFEGEDMNVFTLEEFLEKFPYKIGDKVQHKGATSCGSVFEVEKMRWVNNHIQYTVKGLWYNNCHSIVTAKDLQPFEEETMEERKYADLRSDVDQDDKLATEVTIDGNKITPPKGYLIGKITQVDNGMLVEYVKQQPQYPKTYDECCEVLNIPVNGDIIYGGNWTYGREYLDRHLERLRKYQKLLICHDAYLKIAGEQIGLGKSWEPDWTKANERKYCIVNTEGNIMKWVQNFPTEEMRDAFYMNFKELIEDCKVKK